eukprot:TRINITY_DN7353_c0_g1_i1.p1 TRINITY_DN7353_c0_g1~~TRINITY_DN7353_c0_g1_i1.p1  ORF type:complete len:838 (+),score=239.38 TRINITY_DN7353_c0_g1_i1:60-2573(+)
MADKPKDDSIKVCARFRPLNKLEIAEGGTECVTLHGESGVEIKTGGDTGGNTNKFQFDHVFGSDSEQVGIYGVVGRPVVADIFKGYNGTIFVYGQTGSGKSHTMMGPSVETDSKGIIPRVVEQIFVNVAEADPHIEFSIKVSYVEIYLEKIRDLLDTTKVNLQLREDFKGGKGVYIAEATEQYVGCPDEIFEIMKEGGDNRVVSSTRMNDTSSRSHAIFSISITQKHSVKLDQKTGKLYLVDLAGSEKVGKTNAVGQQLEEAKLINKSLSALGQVITALTDKKATHIPYRDSKLTRLLQDSLGGNSRTSLIICGSMSEYNAFETLSTLRFGQRAKSIQNKAKINRELTVGEYKILLAQMEKEIAALRTGNGLPTTTSAGLDRDSAADTAKLEAELAEEREAMEAEKIELQDEISSLQATNTLQTSLIDRYRSEVTQFKEEVEMWEIDYDELLTSVEEIHALANKQNQVTDERQLVAKSSHEAAAAIGKNVLSLKIAMEKIKTQSENQSISAGCTLDEDQEREIAQWRREKEASRNEEIAFREALLAKIDAFVTIDTALLQLNDERQREAAEVLNKLKIDAISNLNRVVIGDGHDLDPIPASDEGKITEIVTLRKALKDHASGDLVPRSVLNATKEALELENTEKKTEVVRLKAEMERYVSETKELRSSLLKDLQSRCEKVIDLEMALDETRDQFKQLMVASSNKALRQRVQLLEQQHEQQTTNIAEILNENSTLRLEYKLAEKKLDIRNERIENLKTGLKEEKKHMKEHRENAQTERSKLKQECARYKEELNFWKDKCLKAASASANPQSNSFKVNRIIKVLKGGSKAGHDSPHREE